MRRTDKAMLTIREIARAGGRILNSARYEAMFRSNPAFMFGMVNCLVTPWPS